MRARAFLWLIYHYLEAGHDNPFDDAWSRANPGKCPYIYQVDHSSLASENADTSAEILWGQKMTARRSTILDKQEDIEMRNKELVQPVKEKPEMRQADLQGNTSGL